MIPTELSRKVSRIAFPLVAALWGGLIATSCLTPDATFSEEEGEAPAGGEGGEGAVIQLDPNHCANRRVDADEADTDCGGKDCEPCAVGSSCKLGRDCENGECHGGVCQAASCMDDLANGTETDADCGGDSCPACGAGLDCLVESDCESLVCASGACAEPTCGDRVRKHRELRRL
jgi:hypothetical protein